MDNYTIAALVSVIGQVGFPAALFLFLLVKGSNTLGKLTEAINRQTTALAVLNARLRPLMIGGEVIDEFTDDWRGSN